MSDIVERLRELAGWSFEQYGDQGYIEEFMEAADEIEKLRAALGNADACIVCGQTEQARKVILAALGGE